MAVADILHADEHKGPKVIPIDEYSLEGLSPGESHSLEIHAVFCDLSTHSEMLSVPIIFSRPINF